MRQRSPGNHIRLCPAFVATSDGPVSGSTETLTIENRSPRSGSARTNHPVPFLDTCSRPDRSAPERCHQLPTQLRGEMAGRSVSTPNQVRGSFQVRPSVPPTRTSGQGAGRPGRPGSAAGGYRTRWLYLPSTPGRGEPQQTVASSNQPISLSRSSTEGRFRAAPGRPTKPLLPM
jgi:hypothetical protein